jgi:hypothetical protein
MYNLSRNNYERRFALHHGFQRRCSRVYTVSSAGVIASFYLVVRFMDATHLDQLDSDCAAQLLHGLPWSQCEFLPDESLAEVARVAVVHMQLDAFGSVPWQRELLTAMASRLPVFACRWNALQLPSSIMATLFHLHVSHNEPSACFFALLDEFVTSKDATISWQRLVDVLILGASARDTHDRLLGLLISLTPPQDLPAMLKQYACVQAMMHVITPSG